MSFVGVQVMQPGHCGAGAAGHLLCLPRQPPAAGDMQRGKGAAKDCDPLLSRLSCLAITVMNGDKVDDWYWGIP